MEKSDPAYAEMLRHKRYLAVGLDRGSRTRVGVSGGTSSQAGFETGAP